MSSCQPANERCVCVFARYLVVHYYFSLGHKESQIPGKKKRRPSLTRQGLTEQMCNFSGPCGHMQFFRTNSISKRRRELCPLCAVIVQFLRRCLVLKFSMGSTFGRQYYLILALRSQFSEYLHETFYRRALEYLEPAQ